MGKKRGLFIELIEMMIQMINLSKKKKKLKKRSKSRSDQFKNNNDWIYFRFQWFIILNKME